MSEWFPVSVDYQWHDCESQFVIGISTMRWKRYWITDHKTVLTYAISTFVKCRFWDVFRSSLFSASIRWVSEDEKFPCASFDLRKKWSLSQDVHLPKLPCKKLICDVQFPENWFVKGIIWNDFWNSLIWTIHSLSSKIPNIPEFNLLMNPLETPFAVLAMRWVFDKDQLCSLNRKKRLN